MLQAMWVAALLAAAPAKAGGEPRVVDAAELHALLVGGTAVVVDVRSPEEYADAHVPGAIGIPAERIAAEVARLPKDRGAPLAFYCRGAG